jgi:integrase
MDETSALVKVEGLGDVPIPADRVQFARAVLAGAKAPRTRDAYRQAWGAFAAWCTVENRAALPAAASTVAGYLFELLHRRLKVATIEQALAAISEAHKTAGHSSPRSTPLVRGTMQGIRRSAGVAPAQKSPILASELQEIVRALPQGLRGVRDRALLLTGFAGALRRSELVALAVADVKFTPEGLEVCLRRSKTDQEGAGRKIGIPYGSTLDSCPVRSLKAWMDASLVINGALFRQVNRHGQVGDGLTGHAVARIVKRAAAAAGQDPAHVSGHSLRAGLATSAAKAGKSERAIMAQTGHRSVTMVRRYIRDASLFSENAAAGLL